MAIDTVAPPGALQRCRNAYGRLLEGLVILLMVALAVEVTLGVVFRAAGHSLVWYDEVASVLLAWLTFYGSALASARRAHIGCPELVEQLAPGAQRALGVLVQLLVIGFFVLLGWMGLAIMPMLASETLVSLPEVPVNVVQSVIPVSSALIVLAEVLYLGELLMAGAQSETGAALAGGLH